ncbi:hypothetical protein RCL1_000289 [Eukaryota sp. TZLM3-RCL]
MSKPAIDTETIHVFGSAPPFIIEVAASNPSTPIDAAFSFLQSKTPFSSTPQFSNQCILFPLTTVAECRNLLALSGIRFQGSKLRIRQRVHSDKEMPLAPTEFSFSASCRLVVPRLVKLERPNAPMELSLDLSGLNKDDNKGFNDGTECIHVTNQCTCLVFLQNVTQIRLGKNALNNLKFMRDSGFFSLFPSLTHIYLDKNKFSTPSELYFPWPNSKLYFISLNGNYFSSSVLPYLEQFKSQHPKLKKIFEVQAAPNTHQPPSHQTSDVPFTVFEPKIFVKVYSQVSNKEASDILLPLLGKWHSFFNNLDDQFTSLYTSMSEVRVSFDPKINPLTSSVLQVLQGLPVPTNPSLLWLSWKQSQTSTGVQSKITVDPVQPLSMAIQAYPDRLCVVYESQVSLNSSPLCFLLHHVVFVSDEGSVKIAYEWLHFWNFEGQMTPEEVVSSRTGLIPSVAASCLAHAKNDIDDACAFFLKQFVEGHVVPQQHLQCFQ